MITRIDEKNAAEYSILFSRANALLGFEEGSEDYIDNLNKYFTHIVELGKLARGINPEDGTELNESYPFLMRLPLDEPFFEINANTRTITIPSAMKQIGVIGDKDAEIVFFKIDRYYDGQDLGADNISILIEWEYNDKKQYSEGTLIDNQSDIDKLIFGWLIVDDLTEIAGTIKFAVHFIVKDGDNISYRFSSLPAQISIASTLNAELTEENLVNSHINWMRLHNSLPDSSDASVQPFASTPIFIDEPENNSIVNLDENNSYIFEVEAAPSNGLGTISYVFYKEGDSAFDGEADPVYIKTTEIKDYRQYYEKVDENTYQKTYDINVENTLYKKVGRKNLNKPGTYYAKAFNTVSNSKVSNKNSNKIIIPAPELPNIEGYKDFIISKTIYKLVNQDGQIIVDSSEHEPATIDLDADNFIKLPKPLGTYTYKWYKDDVLIDNLTNPKICPINGAGIYSLEITNTLNNDSVTAEKENVCTAITMPEPPTINDQVIEINNFNGEWYIIPNYSVISDTDNMEYEIRVETEDNNDIDEIYSERRPLPRLEPGYGIDIANIPAGTYYVIMYNTVNDITFIKVKEDWKFTVTNN